MPPRNRQDYRTPPRDRIGTPDVQFPTPNVVDVVITEDIVSSEGSGGPLPKGTPHPDEPSAKLVFEQSSKGNNNDQVWRRIYASTRSAQDAYNASVKYVSESSAHPVFIRTYLLPRPVAPETANQPLTSLIGLTLVAGGTGWSASTTVSFSGGAGTGATARCVVRRGVIVGLVLTSGGSGYTSAPTVAFTGGGTGASATALLQPTSAVLTHQEATPAEGEFSSIFDRVTRVYTTQPGPVLRSLVSSRSGLLLATEVQPVAPGEIPATPTGIVLSTAVSKLSTTEAELRVVKFVNADGTDAAGFPIYQTSRLDPESKIEIVTDHFLAPSTYVLPDVYIADEISTQPDWKTIATSGVAYTTTSYSPRHYVIAARKGEGDGNSDLVSIQIDHVAELTSPKLYNAARKFVEEAAAYPVYVRDFFQKHPVTPATRNQPLSSLVGITLTAGGSGYGSSVSVAITGAGSGAAASAMVSGGVVRKLYLLLAGTGYTAGTTATISNGVTHAAATATAAGGLVTVLSLSDGGTGYSSAPTVTISGNGTGATATATLTGTSVSSLTITNAGSGYSAATVAFSGGGAGTGATAVVVLQDQGCLLTEETIVPAPGDMGAVYDRVTRVYTTLPGPWVYDYQSYERGLFLRTARRRVVPTALPGTVSGVIFSDKVRQLSTTEAEQVIVSLVTSDGSTAASGFPIHTTERKDPTGVTIFTDHFIAPRTYDLPSTYTVGVTSTEWFQPNTDGVGYTSTPYSPKRYVVDGRSRAVGEGSDNKVVEIDYCRKPDASVRDVKISYIFPALFSYNDIGSIPNDYQGRYQPPWPIGDDQPNGYSFTDHRVAIYAAREFTTYSIGRREGLPPTFSVTTPGKASKFFKGLIPDRCIHPPISSSETLPDGSVVIIEDIPSSTPASYDPRSILVAEAEEEQWHGEIYRQRVVLISESLPLKNFPDPTSEGYYRANAPFKATPAISISGSRNGKKVFARLVSSTGGTGTEVNPLTSNTNWTVRIYGRVQAGQKTVDVTENIIAKPTPDSASTSTNSWLTIRAVMLANSKPTRTDSIQICEPVDPDNAFLEFLSNPVDGKKLKIGKVGSEVMYEWKSSFSGLGTANQILLGSSPRYSARNLREALRGEALGSHVGAGTVVHPDVATIFDPGNRKMVMLVTKDPINGNTFTVSPGMSLSGYDADGTTPNNTYYDITAWAAGSSDSNVIATIDAGRQRAYANADFAANQVILTDESNDNDAKAKPTIPPGAVLYTDWLAIPAGKTIRLDYCNASPKPVRVAWQNLTTLPTDLVVVPGISVTNGSATITAVSSDYVGKTMLIGNDLSFFTIASTTTLSRTYTGTTGTYAARIYQTLGGIGSVTVTNGSATISAVSAANIGKAVFIADDPLENEIISTTALVRPFVGTSGTYTIAVFPNAATLIATAVNSKLRQVSIGTPIFSYIRLKLTQTSPPYQFMPMFAAASWIVTPDD